MATKQHNRIIIGLSILIAAVILITRWHSSSNRPHRITSEVHKVVNGWGYDILVDDKILIRQESIPVLQQQQAFATPIQAEKTARLVIQKLQAGQHPALSTFDLEKVLPQSVLDNGR